MVEQYTTLKDRVWRWFVITTPFSKEGTYAIPQIQEVQLTPSQMRDQLITKLRFHLLCSGKEHQEEAETLENVLATYFPNSLQTL